MYMYDTVAKLYGCCIANEIISVSLYLHRLKKGILIPLVVNVSVSSRPLMVV